MVRELHQITEAIKATDEEIERVCLDFAEYSYVSDYSGFWSWCIAEGFRLHW